MALLGLSADFDRPLRVEPSIYEFAGQYNDSLGVLDHQQLRHSGRGSAPRRRSSTSAYAPRGSRLPDAARPGVSGRSRHPHRLGQQDDSEVFPRFVAVCAHAGAVAVRAGPLLPSRADSWRLAPLGFIAVVLATLMIGAVNVRAAGLVVLVIVGFAGAAAVQFDERHFYYLQFIPWFAFALLARVALEGRAAVRKT